MAAKEISNLHPSSKLFPEADDLNNSVVISSHRGGSIDVTHINGQSNNDAHTQLLHHSVDGMNDTMNNPFNDFDGVHFDKSPPQSATVPDNLGKHHFVQREGKDLVYYPAPVPVMLNLPPKLSESRIHTQIKTSQIPIEDPPPRREPSTSFRKSLALKSYRSKADVSSLFENILDATVASPVLSVVSHSVSNTKSATSNRHGRSASKLSLSGLDDRNLENEVIGKEDGKRTFDNQVSKSSFGQIYTEIDSSAVSLEPSGVEADMIIDEPVLDEQPRASQYPHSSYSDDTDDGQARFVPATLLAELESRKSQQRARTNKSNGFKDTQQMPTLLERDAIAEVKQQARKRGPVNLAWQGDQPAIDEAEDDVPLGVLFANKLSSRPEEAMRAPGLLAMREAEDNEPLRRRQERLKHMAPEPFEDVTDEKETLGQRRSRLQAQRGRENNTERDDTDFAIPTTVNSMSALLQSNPQKQSYVRQQDHNSRGLLSSELPFGYQAQQKMHLNFMGYQGPAETNASHFPQHQYDHPIYQNRNTEMGIPFPYAPVNAAYLQQQQAILADQIEKWRSCVW